jgi:hypothetical protein
MYYEKLLFINNNKFNNWFLLGVKSLISNIYKKNIELNIVDLKYLHLNSHNFIQAISKKIKNRKNRLIPILKKAIRLVRIPTIRLINPSLPSLIEKGGNKEGIKSGNQVVMMEYSNKKYRYIGKDITSFVIKKTKYNVVNGVKLEVAGRLSKRLTASRSVFKYKEKGSLKNIDSSYKNLSSIISKGYAKPNIQYTNLKSKTRNGAFGLKG